MIGWSINMKTLNIAICDDNRFYSVELKTKIENILFEHSPEFTANFGIYFTGEDILDSLQNPYDIYFLDICLNETNGIEIACKIKEHYPDSYIVFITSFIKFSLDGYRANAFRYILKDSIDLLLPECINAITTELTKSKQTITVHSTSGDIPIFTSKIMYIESSLHEQHIYLNTGHKITIVASMSSIKEQLNEDDFIQPHRSYLVNIAYIQQINNTYLELKTGTTIPVSKYRHNSLCLQFMQYIAQI